MPYRPSVTGLSSVLLVTIMSGRRKLFQVATKMNRKIVTIAGARSRSTMVKKMRNSPAPSIRAASSSSSGTDVAAYMRPRKTPNGLTQLGMIIDQMVSVKPRECITMYRGIVSSAIGRSSPPRTASWRTLAPRNLNLLIP